MHNQWNGKHSKKTQYQDILDTVCMTLAPIPPLQPSLMCCSARWDSHDKNVLFFIQFGAQTPKWQALKKNCVPETYRDLRKIEDIGKSLNMQNNLWKMESKSGHLFPYEWCVWKIGRTSWQRAHPVGGSGSSGCGRILNVLMKGARERILVQQIDSFYLCFFHGQNLV